MGRKKRYHTKRRWVQSEVDSVMSYVREGKDPHEISKHFGVTTGSIVAIIRRVVRGDKFPHKLGPFARQNDQRELPLAAAGTLPVGTDTTDKKALIELALGAKISREAKLKILDALI